MSKLGTLVLTVMLMTGCTILQPDKVPSGQPSADPGGGGADTGTGTDPGSKPGQSGNGSAPKPADSDAGSSGGALSPEQAKAAVSARAADVLAALKAKDMGKLARYAHPEKGIRFSPYTYVNAKTDHIVKPGELEKLMQSREALLWGSYDGSGEPIRLTFADYYDKFVYDHDYAQAEKTAYNETVGKGNTSNNIRDIYPDAIVAEYYFSGFDAEYQGMDWASLRLVFEKSEAEWMLVGIVKDQWTI